MDNHHPPEATRPALIAQGRPVRRMKRNTMTGGSAARKMVDRDANESRLTETLEPGAGDSTQAFLKVRDRHGVPEAWPALLSREQLCAYIGVGASTITRVCPVRPLDMGANVVRYSRAQIDEWVATLPPRLMVPQLPRSSITTMADVQAPTDVAESRVEAALDRVRARAGGPKWRKTA